MVKRVAKKAPAPLLKIRKQTLMEKAKRKPSKWVQFLKQKVAETGESYGCLASKPEIRQEYHVLNPKRVKKSKAEALELSRKQEAAAKVIQRAFRQRALRKTKNPVVDNTEIQIGEVLPKQVLQQQEVVPEKEPGVWAGPLRRRKKPVVDNTLIPTGQVIPQDVVQTETQVSSEPANSL